MSDVVRIKRPPRLRVVTDNEEQRVFGSREFIARTRNPAIRPPKRFEPTIKNEGDVVL